MFVNMFQLFKNNSRYLIKNNAILNIIFTLGPVSPLSPGNPVFPWNKINMFTSSV